MLLVELFQPVLEAFPLLNSSGHVRLYALGLALNLGFDFVELAGDGVFIVTLLLPCGFLGCSLLNLIFRNISKLVGLERIVSCSVLGLANVLSKLKDTLALAFIASSSIGQAVAECLGFLPDRADGSLVILLGSLQAVALVLKVSFGCGNRILQRCGR